MNSPEMGLPKFPGWPWRDVTHERLNLDRGHAMARDYGRVASGGLTILFMSWPEQIRGTTSARRRAVLCTKSCQIRNGASTSAGVLSF